MKEVLVGRRYRHKKGGVYEVLGISTPGPVGRRAVVLQSQHTEVGEGDENREVRVGEGWVHDPAHADSLVHYRGDDGRVWARPLAMFTDGRFELLEPERGEKTPEELRRERFKKLPAKIRERIPEIERQVMEEFPKKEE